MPGMCSSLNNNCGAFTALVDNYFDAFMTIGVLLYQHVMCVYAKSTKVVWNQPL